jgi:hypothetical protein
MCKIRKIRKNKMKERIEKRKRRDGWIITI